VNLLSKILRKIVSRYQVISARILALWFDMKKIKHDVGMDSEVQTLLKDLNANGFVKVDFFVNEIGGFDQKVKSTFDRNKVSDPKVVGQNIKHPFLFSEIPGKVLHNKKLQQLLKGYLGEDAVFDLKTNSSLMIVGFFVHQQ